MKQYSLGKVLRAGVWGTIVGGAVGFGLGLLIAPEEGQKVRRRLVYQLDNLARLVASYVEQLMRAEEESEAKRTGDALVADAQAKAEKIRQDIDALLGEIQRKDAIRNE